MKKLEEMYGNMNMVIIAEQQI